MKISKLDRTILYTTVFTTGAAVLVFEVAAVRLLTPYFGSSLYVLSSVLSVILASLAIGYYFGGRMADKFPYPKFLYFLLALGGGVMVLLFALSQIILPFSPTIFSLISGPLVMALSFFFVPALLLGVDSPYVITLINKHTDPKESGAVVGTVFFWSTVGSILGSLLAGFYFIPYWGLTNTMLGVSLFLVLGSTTAAFYFNQNNGDLKSSWSQKLNTGFLAILVFSLFIAYGIKTSTTEALADADDIYHTDGFYSDIRVFDRYVNGEKYRFLKNDTNNSSAILPGSDMAVFPYSQPADAYTLTNPDAETYLVLGGGAFAIPRYLNQHYPDLEITTVEMEPKLRQVAVDYFEYPDNHPKLIDITGDARVFLQSETKKYDIIFSDVMNSGNFIPPHLSTVEFFTAMRERLSDDGMAFINVIAALDTDSEKPTLSGSLLKTIAAVFPNLKVITIAGPEARDIQNLIVTVRKDEQEIIFPEDKMISSVFANTSFPINEALVSRNELDLDHHLLLTDDTSRVETLVFSQFKGVR